MDDFVQGLGALVFFLVCFACFVCAVENAVVANSTDWAYVDTNNCVYMPTVTIHNAKVACYVSNHDALEAADIINKGLIQARSKEIIYRDTRAH